MPPLESLIYTSRACEGMSGLAVERIVDRAQANNARDGITGALLAYGGWFVQMLEGEPDKLRACFDRIAADPRHAEVRVLEHAPIDQRAFGPWAMRHVHLDQARDPAVAGFMAQLARQAGPSDVALAKALLRRLAQPPSPPAAAG